MLRAVADLVSLWRAAATVDASLARKGRDRGRWEDSGGEYSFRKRARGKALCGLQGSLLARGLGPPEVKGGLWGCDEATTAS